MNRGLVVVIPVMIAALAGVSTAEAQLRPWQISIAGGPSFATGEFSDQAGTGYNVQGSVGFSLPLLPFGVRGDLFWQELPDEEDGWFRQIGGLLNAVFEVPLVIVQPYGLVGGGVLRTDTPDVDHTGHVHTGESETTVGLNAGLGIEFPFAGLGGFVEARYLNLVGGGDATHFQSIPVTIGIRF
ncbi:MAG: outer membrane beta-barrel protein [Gemmatimonadota bacterium]